MWIRPILPDAASDALRDIYREIARRRGKVWNLYLAHSHLPPGVLRAHLDLYMHLMFDPGGLPRHYRELIGCYVSFLNRCRY